MEKVRRRLADFSAQLNGEGVLLPTFSAGVAEYSSDEIVHSFIERADAALYTIKHNGRDRVEVHRGAGFADIQGCV